MNKIIIVSDDKSEKTVETPPSGLTVEWLGDDGCLKISSSCTFKNCKFQINTNSLIEIGRKSNVNGLFIRCAATDSVVRIGEHFTISSGEFILANGGHHQSLIIGNDCLFSSHVAIFTSDGHSMIDGETGQVLNNIGGNITIGNHCWVGYRVILTKSARLAPNTIVGANSLVSKAFTDEFCCIAGQPAKVLKTNVKWSIKHPSVYKGV